MWFLACGNGRRCPDRLVRRVRLTPAGVRIALAIRAAEMKQSLIDI